MIAEAGKNILALTFMMVVIFLMAGCRANIGGSEAGSDVLMVKWESEMREVFPEWTNDTAEIKRRLDYFRQTGNKLGQQAMLRQMGNTERFSSRFRSAVEYHSMALQLAYDINDTVLITTSLNELGTDFRRIGTYEEAIEYHYKSLQLSEAYKGNDTVSITRNIASSYNGIGIIYSTMNQPEEAINAYQKALKIEVGKNNLKGMAMNHANIGSVYFNLGDYEKAEEFFNKSLDNNVEAELQMGIALCNINIGRVHETKGKDEEALNEYQKAYDILSQMPDKWHWIKSGLQLGGAYIKKGDYNKANLYLQEALKTAQEIDSHEYTQEAYELISEYHYKTGNYKLSADFMRRSHAYADTVRQNLESNRLLESRIKYETEKYVRQIEELDKQNKEQEVRRRNSMLTILPVMAILIGLLLLILYKRKLEKQQAAELKKLDKMRSNFFTNLTHELRTPITVINGLGSHLLERVSDSCCADAQDLQAMKRQGQHLMHLVNLLLEFSRSESGIVKPKWRHADMVEYLNVITESYKQYARNNGIELFVYSEENKLNMNFMPSSMKKVMDNLISNAIKNCSEGDSIVAHLRYDRQNGFCDIVVKDSGRGILPEDLPNIFELYYTGNSESKQTGIGIGLALTKQLVTEMGGKISVKSTPGKGAEFTVTLPVSDVAIPPDEQEEFFDEHMLKGNADLYPNDDEDEEQSVTTGNAGSGKKTVLIVEDNKDLAHYISVILSPQYAVIHASNGVEGLLMAEQYIPDLVITDIMMPEKDGYEFTEELRNSMAVSHIPVIMITAKVTTEDKLEGLKSGADAYLAKPFDERELLVRIEQLLKSRALLMETYRNVLMGTEKGNVGENNHNMAFITKLAAAVNSHLDDQEYFPNGLASYMCLSEAQVNRKLKAMTGHTITSFVMRARLNKSKQLLLKRNMNITEVALSCGFSDLSYFSRSFKKVFGYTPSQFMKIPEDQN